MLRDFNSIPRCSLHSLEREQEPQRLILLIVDLNADLPFQVLVHRDSMIITMEYNIALMADCSRPMSAAERATIFSLDKRVMLKRKKNKL